MASQYLDSPETYQCYNPGETAEYDPAQEDFKHMVTLFAYDIADPKRLAKVAKTCEKFGERIEKSLFQFDIPENMLEDLWKKLTGLIDEEEDALISYRVCKTCLQQVKTCGIVQQPEVKILYLI